MPIDQQLYAEAVEILLYEVLGQLDGVPDDDTVRAGLVLSGWLEHIRGFENARPSVLRDLELAIENEMTSGELRGRIRKAIAEVARG